MTERVAIGNSTRCWRTSRSPSAISVWIRVAVSRAGRLGAGVRMSRSEAAETRTEREILRAFLESRGYTVTVAAEGTAALARMEQVRPALVLLDVMMPGMDGWQVCRTIKNHPEYGGTTKVVMVTAKGAFEDKFEGLRSGADDYVVKPVDFKDLLEKVERNLAARGTPA